MIMFFFYFFFFVMLKEAKWTGNVGAGAIETGYSGTEKPNGLVIVRKLAGYCMLKEPESNRLGPFWVIFDVLPVSARIPPRFSSYLPLSSGMHLGLG